MPMPERYKEAIPEMAKTWSAQETFRGQARIWGAHVQARHELEGEPSQDEVATINAALTISDNEVDLLNEPTGHETVKLQRLVQAKLPQKLRNYIHKGATSSDILDTYLALQILQSLVILQQDYIELEKVLLKLAFEYKHTLQVGRTHLQHAIPQYFGRQVLNWYARVKQADRRITNSIEIISFGKWSGEIGTHAFNSPELEDRAMAILGLKSEPAATQVIPRDRHAEVISLMAVNQATLDTIAVNIRLLSGTDTGELREPFDEHGSSAMPHKRNPELSERVSGLGRIVRGMMSAEHESVQLWLERDISHSSAERFIFSSTFQILDYSVRLATKVADGLIVYKDRMLENLETSKGGIYSAGLLNFLIDAGVDRTAAYERVKTLAQRAYDEKSHLMDLALKDPFIYGNLSPDLLEQAFDPQTYLKNTDIAYKRLGVE